MIEQQYNDTLNWLFKQLPMYQREGKSAYKADLNTTLAMDKYFVHPHRSYRTIHIAGTNGKGSVSHMLASILQTAGYKVGLYTSPHLRDFRERIKINGKPVPREQVVNFVRKHQSLFEELHPSFFEMTVAMAFQIFKEEQIDVAIVEVGMGGRLDSTNIIRPDLSVITNISLDHTQFLGNNVKAIAGEKAGILKADVPVVLGTNNEEVKQVVSQISAEVKAPLVLAHEQIGLTSMGVENGLQCFVVQDFANNEILPQKLSLDLLGSYQQENLRTVLAGISSLTDYKISEVHIVEGLREVVKKTGLLGRYQVLQEEPRVICDTGHNQAGLSYVLSQLTHEEFEQLHIVMGVVNDKSIDEILPMFPKSAKYYFTNADIPRALPASELQEKAIAKGLKGEAYKSVACAFEAAKKNASGKDLIFIGGSTFVVAEVV